VRDRWNSRILWSKWTCSAETLALTRLPSAIDTQDSQPPLIAAPPASPKFQLNTCSSLPTITIGVFLQGKLYTPIGVAQVLGVSGARNKGRSGRFEGCSSAGSTSLSWSAELEVRGVGLMLWRGMCYFFWRRGGGTTSGSPHSNADGYPQAAATTISGPATSATPTTFKTNSWIPFSDSRVFCVWDPANGREAGG